MSIPFGGIELDPIELAINGNAILGIKESGKSYLGTELGEVFFDAKIPFITFDPIGIWHNMRYPGRGKGFPIVVAGGFHGDLELTPANAPSIVEAAMKERVSLVLDLFHPELSKADWRKIVKDCAFLLLHKNAQHGLRHIFIEEAAEFVPQTVRDGFLFDAVERVIRMGGNSGLGCTLISPRSQEINKSVLELCENLFLFRQRGKNALENIKKWLDVAGADGKEVMRTLPTMPRGECWAWLGGSDHPVHVKVPQKRSFHPDRRATPGDVAAVPKGSAVDVKKFVGALAKALPEIEAAVAANDPKILKARIAELEKGIAARAPAADPSQAAEIERLARDYEALATHAGGQEEEIGRLRADLKAAEPAVAAMKIFGPVLEGAFIKAERAMEALRDVDKELDELQKIKESVDPDALPRPQAPASVSPAPPPRPAPVPRMPLEPRMIETPVGLFTMTGTRQKIIDKIAWANVFFNSFAVERGVLAFLLGKHPRTKSVLNDLSALKTGGYVDYVPTNSVVLTKRGQDAAARPPANPSWEELIVAVKSVLSPRQGEMLDLLPLSPGGGDDGLISRSAIAEHFGLHERTKSFLNDLSRMKSLGLIRYEPGQMIGAADFLKRR